MSSDTPVRVQPGPVAARTERRLRGLPALIAPLLAAAAVLPLAGCGLAGTAASTATGAASEAEQAKEAKATEDRVKQQLDAATREAAQQREEAEKAAQ